MPALTMPSRISITTLFLCMIISALALPPQLQTYLSGQRSLPAWAHEVKPASLHHNLHSDTALPVSVKIEGPGTEATSALPSAPTSLLPWLQSAEWTIVSRVTRPYTPTTHSPITPTIEVTLHISLVRSRIRSPTPASHPTLIFAAKSWWCQGLRLGIRFPKRQRNQRVFRKATFKQPPACSNGWNRSFLRTCFCTNVWP